MRCTRRTTRILVGVVLFGVVLFVVDQVVQNLLGILLPIGDVFYTLLWIALPHMVVLIGLVHVWELRRLRGLMIVGMVALGATFLFWAGLFLVAIQSSSLAENLAPKVGGPLSIIAPTIAMMGVLSLLRVSNRGGVWTRRATMVLVGLTATVLAVNIAAFRSDTDWRVFTLLCIASMLGLIGLLIWTLIERADDGETVADARRLSFTATCPRCGSSQPMRTHGDHCDACGLKISVTPT